MDMDSKENMNQTQEEPAPVKAQIVIKKGGQFFTEADATENVFDAQSLMKSAGLSADFISETMGELNAMTDALGLTDEELTGYKDGQVIKVQMNPNSYTITSRTNFKNERMGGIRSESATFGFFAPPHPRTLSVKLFYDIMLQADYLNKLSSLGKDVANSLTSVSGITNMGMQLMSTFKKFSGKEDIGKLYLDKLLGLTRILKGINTPPLVSFQYGSTAFEGYVKDVNVVYQRFNQVGEVTRAEVSMTIEESNIFSEKEGGSGAEAPLPSLSSDSKVMDNSPL